MTAEIAKALNWLADQPRTKHPVRELILHFERQGMKPKAARNKAKIAMELKKKAINERLQDKTPPIKINPIATALQREAKACWIPALQTMPYREFLLTRYWFTIRNAKLAQAEKQCETCGARYGLQIHHTSYEMRGLEHECLDFLVVLCDFCHRKRHHK